MRETITVQVGQCGNQIGNLFWQLLLLEHEKTPDTDDALSAYFRFEPSGFEVLLLSKGNRPFQFQESREIFKHML